MALAHRPRPHTGTGRRLPDEMATDDGFDGLVAAFEQAVPR